ncbi:MAG: hypothetical protein ACXQTI_00335 [Candidatus Nezhaarchaeales archaeon]
MEFTYPFTEIEKKTLKALTELVCSSRGNCITFTCKKLAKMAGLSTKPVTLTLVREVLEELRRQGLITIYKKSRHSVKYMLTKDSPLWKLLEQGVVRDLESLKKFIEVR